MRPRIINKYITAILGLLLGHQAYCQTNLPPTDAEMDARIEHYFKGKHHEGETAPSHADIDAYIKRQMPKFDINMPVTGVITIVRQECWVGVRAGRTNLLAYRPLPTQAFDAHLIGQDGKGIAKSEAGRLFGQKLQPDEQFKEFQMKGRAAYAEGFDGSRRGLYFLEGSDGNDHYWDFNIVKSFEIKEPGEYRLQVQVRLFARDTNGVFQPFILPTVEKPVKISMSDLVR